MEHQDSDFDGVVMCYQNFEYSLVDLVNDEIIWQCRYKDILECNSTMKTKDAYIVQEPTAHNHERIKLKTIKKTIDEQMNHKGNPLTPPYGVLLDPTDSLNETTVFTSRSHSEENCPAPTRIRKELVIPSFTSGIPIEYADLVVHDCSNFNEDGILVLGNKTLMAHLSADLIYGISFHHNLPPKFTQLYTWHAKIGQLYFPCIYVLMKTQDIKSYVDMFDVLKTTLPKVNPKKILMDFHVEAMMAARGAFPLAEVKGSYYNMTQILLEKAEDLGIEKFNKREIEAKLSLMCLPSLMFVPPEDVKNLFDELALSFPMKRPFTELFAYFFAKFIEGPMGTEPRFPIPLWNHYYDALEDKAITKNTADILHKAVYSQFQKWGDCPWYLLRIIKMDANQNAEVLANFDRVEPGFRETKPQAHLSKVVKRYAKMTNKMAYLHVLTNLL